MELRVGDTRFALTLAGIFPYLCKIAGSERLKS
jgi:hypothetical protein